MHFDKLSNSVSHQTLKGPKRDTQLSDFYNPYQRWFLWMLVHTYHTQWFHIIIQ